MAAWASVKMVTVPSVRFLVAATRSALAIAAHSASYASWPQVGFVARPDGTFLPGGRVSRGQCPTSGFIRHPRLRRYCFFVFFCFFFV